MSKIRSIGLAAIAALCLAACGGGNDGPTYSKMVVFGDSLSDVGTYATPGVLALGGGKYTVNGAGVQIWVERIAAEAGVAAPCAAQTGLEASGPLANLAAPIKNVSGCFDYAQGGARVTERVGPANKALLAAGDTDGYLGQLTDPVINQITRHLAIAGGAFTGDELVTVLAGGNDLFMNLAAVGAGGDPAAAVTAMGAAGAQLAGYVKSLIVAKGATHVVVVNLPDVSQTPFGQSSDVATQGLIRTMVTTFNDQLSSALKGTVGVLFVDAYTQGQDQFAHPAAYAISNGTDTACDLVKTPIGSLTCSAQTVIAGDISHYQYADTVHPTPFGYRLLADFVAANLVDAGWL